MAELRIDTQTVERLWAEQGQRLNNPTAKSTWEKLR